MIYNRIPVIVGGLRKINLPPIMYQYDQVQKLILTDIELPESYRVDFCNDGDTRTITMVGTADGVEIPNQLLQTGKPIKAFVVLSGIDENAVETRIDINIPVNKRPPASDIAPTPAQQTTIDTLIEAMNTAVENAETAEQGAKDAQQAIEDMTVSAETLAPGSAATVTKTIIENVVHLLFGIPRGQQGEQGDPGEKGDTGNGIASITLISTVGLDKTYRIAYTNGNHFDYVVKDGAKGDTGNGIYSIYKTGTSGKVDTYTILFTDGNTTDFTVTNGTDGTDGEDGVSPEVTITTITGGHRVTITDADHPTGQSFDVMDGQDGQNTDAEHVTYDSTQTYSSGTVGNALNQLNSDITKIYSDNHLPYTVVEKKIINADGTYTTNANARTIIIPLTNVGMIVVHNCNRRNFSADSIVGFDSNDSVVTSGVTYKTADLAYKTALIPASTVVKIAISMWNVNFPSGTYVIDKNPVVYQVASQTTNTLLAMKTEYPFVSNIYDSSYFLRAILFSNGTTLSTNSALGTYGYIPVEPGDTLTFSFPNTSYDYSALKPFIQYYDSAFGYVSNARYGSGTFTVPSGIKYAVIFIAVADVNTCVITRTLATAPNLKIDERSLPTISSTDFRAYPIYATIENNVAELTFKYNAASDMTVQMQKQGGLDGNDQPTGGNQLFDFCRWFLTANTSQIVTDSPNTDTSTGTFQINGTDFLAPYRVRAVNNADGDKAANNDFTGGNHQYNNSGSGSTATARTANIVFSVDGKITTSYSGYCREVTIEWDNFIQGNNTKKSDGTGREILKEHYTVRFDGNYFHVENQITALEDLYIYTYYGMQMKQQYAHINNYSFLYLGSKTMMSKQEAPASGTFKDSGDKACRDIVNYNYYSASAFYNNIREMHIYDEGLGDFSYVKTTNSSCRASSGKLYFNLIDAFDNSSSTIDTENVLTLNANDIIYYRGWYRFYYQQ